jgi:chemotaxis signal transduction protein
MRLTSTTKPKAVRAEQIILFRVSGQLFAVSSAAVQEVRSVDSFTGAAAEINLPELPKVAQTIRRGDKSIYLVKAAVHFGLEETRCSLVFVLRNTRVILLIEGIEKMTTMTQLQALPQSFCHAERLWYRGLTALDQTVVPVVKPDGFLTDEELAILDVTPVAELAESGVPS